MSCVLILLNTWLDFIPSTRKFQSCLVLLRSVSVVGLLIYVVLLLFFLLFADAPACQTELSGTDAPIIIAASRSEDVNITCEMDALPDRLKFQWTHTNTVGENSELESDMYSSIGSKSLLRYHLRSEEDFGTLLCWAHNSIGAAERPCVYQLVPAGLFALFFIYTTYIYCILTYFTLLFWLYYIAARHKFVNLCKSII